MKINWGTGITIAIIGFMSFILYMVYQATNTNADLYAEDYYDQEIKFQDKIDATSNYKALKEEISIQQNETAVTIEFPTFFSTKEVTGSIYFYRANDAKLDKIFPISLSDNHQKINKSNLVAGIYTVQASWSSNNTSYFFKTKITIN